jgi:hypothetical protein
MELFGIRFHKIPFFSMSLLFELKAQGKSVRNELVEKGFADSRYSAKRQRLLELTRVKAQGKSAMNECIKNGCNTII